MSVRRQVTPTPLPIWEQEKLFTGGYSLLTAELTWHLNGPAGTVDVGYSIKSTDADEQVELGTLGRLGTLECSGQLYSILFEIHERCLRGLSPF